MTSPDEVEAFCLEKLDCVVVGSDAVFRLVPKYEPRTLFKRLIGRKTDSAFSTISDHVSPYFLNWQQHRNAKPKKASIAASAMGTLYQFLKPNLYPQLYRAINDFDFISVRDEWTRQMVSRLGLGRQHVEMCPDPVFSLNKNFNILDPEMPSHELFNTILLSGRFPKPWRKTFVDIAHAKGYRVGNLPNPENSYEFPEADVAISLPLSPIAWYQLIAQAAGFVGVRFHALVSSVANRKPAISVDTPRKLSISIKRRNKIYDLWKRVGCPHRFYTMEQISRTSAKQIMDVLFDENDLQRETEYAERAKDTFTRVVQEILTLVS